MYILQTVMQFLSRHDTIASCNNQELLLSAFTHCCEILYYVLKYKLCKKTDSFMFLLCLEKLFDLLFNKVLQKDVEANAQTYAAIMSLSQVLSTSSYYADLGVVFDEIVIRFVDKIANALKTSSIRAIDIARQKSIQYLLDHGVLDLIWRAFRRNKKSYDKIAYGIQRNSYALDLFNELCDLRELKKYKGN